MLSFPFPEHRGTGKVAPFSVNLGRQLSWQGQPAQPQRAADDRHTAEGYDRAGDHEGAEQQSEHGGESGKRLDSVLRYGVYGM